jgi:regulation of enolase protein 1 (concanavalin A-like superfamily)
VIRDEAIYYRVERRGTELISFRSADGKEWSRFASQTFPGLTRKLSVGVAAVNSTRKEFAPQFEELKLAR